MEGILMSRIVNFHPNEAPLRFNVHGSFGYSDYVIFKEGVNDVHTYQMGLLDRAWERGLIIRIWYQDVDLYTYVEFKHGDVAYGKELRKEHNFYRLWVGGALGNHLITGFKE